MKARIQSWHCAGAATLFVLCWQAATVQFNTEGNWTSLYHSGEYAAAPPYLGPEDIYRFVASTGYDGQFYHFLAHDPLLVRGAERYLDNPRLRWRRILVPGLANVVAMGNDDYVDSVYIGIIAAFVFLGTMWLSQIAAAAGRSRWLGVAFLAIPAVPVSLDRMTVDAALAALCVGLIRFELSLWAVAPILVAAPLVRESGILLPFAFAVWSASHGRWRPVWVSAMCCLPFLAWVGYVHARTGSDQTTWSAFIPFLGIAGRTWHPVQYAISTNWLKTAAVLDYIALLGIWLALAMTFRKWPRTLPEIAACGFALMAMMLSKPDVWTDAYAFGRTLSPLLLFLALDGLRRGWPLLLLPMLIVLPRIVFQFGPQWKGVLKGLRAAAF